MQASTSLSPSALRVPSLQGHDAISTSSSTLVNAAATDGRGQYSAASPSHARRRTTGERRRPSASSSRSSTVIGSRVNRSGWMKDEHNRFADDHRCSDQEIEAGLCSCMRNTSQSSASESDEPLGRKRDLPEGSLRPTRLDRADEDEDSAAASVYQRKLHLARQRKLLSDRSDASLSVHLPTRPRLHLRASNEFASDPAWPAENLYSSPPRRSQVPRRASSPIRRSPASSPRQKENTQSTPPQSAARKSISTVYERLLREEEKRREEERDRKEAARRRRKSERDQRQEDSLLLERLTKAANDSAERANNSDIVGSPDRQKVALHPSPILSISPPSMQQAQIEEPPRRINERLHPLDVVWGTAKQGTGLNSLSSSSSKNGAEVALLAPAWPHDNVSAQTLPSTPKETNGPLSIDAVPSHTLSPRIASPVSSDSVRSFSFPNRASPQLSSSPQAAEGSGAMLSPQLQGQTHSPNRRSGHRRGTERDVLSRSARSPILDAFQETDVVVSPLLAGEESKRSPTGRRVKFSPQPEIIAVFQDEGEDSRIDDPLQVQSDKAEEAPPQEDEEDDWNPPAVESKNQIDLDAALGELSANELSVPTPVSPAHQSFASPRFPGMYASPAAQPVRRNGSPPMFMRAKLESSHGAPPRSRSWGSNLSLASDASMSGDLGILEEEEDQVTEGVSSVSIPSIPLTSTPPRPPKVRSNVFAGHADEDRDTPGDDSLRITLNQLRQALRHGEDNKEMSVQTDAVATVSEKAVLPVIRSVSDTPTTTSQAIDVLAAGVHDVAQEVLFERKDQEYMARLEAARRRLATIAKAYDGRRASHFTPTPQGHTLLLAATAFAVVQVALFLFMTAAAHAKSEQMYFTIYHDPTWPTGDYAIGRHSFGQLVQPLLTSWGVLPDAGRLAMGEHNRLATLTWWHVLLRSWDDVRRNGAVRNALGAIFAKLAFQLGFYGVNIIPLGYSLAS